MIDAAKQNADIAKMIEMSKEYPDDVWRSIMCQVMRATFCLPGGENLGEFIDRTSAKERDQCEATRKEADLVFDHRS